MKDFYQDLLNIEKPVLIYVKYFHPDRFGDRVRLLYPDGRCEYFRVNFSPVNFEICCYSRYENINLKETVERMKIFDGESKLEITGVVEFEQALAA